MVTPLVGVWIEISGGPLRCSLRNVTPLVGVWIEISYELPYRGQAHSHSPCGSVDWNIVTNAEHNRRTCHSPCGSVDWNLSACVGIVLPSGHSPCGSVDWNNYYESKTTGDAVTPLVGVWIEISANAFCLGVKSVTPLVGVWIEMMYSKIFPPFPLGHSPCGSVDWNSFPLIEASARSVTPLVGVWIEIVWGLAEHTSRTCHSPCGSVDWNRLNRINNVAWRCHSPCGSVDWNP